MTDDSHLNYVERTAHVTRILNITGAVCGDLSILIIYCVELHTYISLFMHAVLFPYVNHTLINLIGLYVASIMYMRAVCVFYQSIRPALLLVSSKQIEQANKGHTITLNSHPVMSMTFGKMIPGVRMVYKWHGVVPTFSGCFLGVQFLAILFFI